MMYTEILHHIETLQLEIAHADPDGRSTSVALAVAEIAAELRAAPASVTRTESPVSMPNG